MSDHGAQSKERKRVGGARPGSGAPRGNKNALRHSLHYFKRLLSGDGLKRSTALYHAIAIKEQELIVALGGDPSPQELAIIADTVKNMLFVGSLEHYLLGLKSLVRRGKAHVVLTERTRLAAHVRENLKTLGLKRVAVEIPDLARLLGKPAENPQSARTPLTATNGEYLGDG